MSDIETDKYAYPGKRFTPTGIVAGEGQGMSMRDYFAGLWVAAGHHANLSPQEAAEQAFDFADAMMAQRVK